jgi:hypothetical protein
VNTYRPGVLILHALTWALALSALYYIWQVEREEEHDRVVEHNLLETCRAVNGNVVLDARGRFAGCTYSLQPPPQAPTNLRIKP